MSRARLATAVLAFALALPAAAAADPPWTQPQNVSSPTIFPGPLLGAVAGADGRALAFWNSQDTTEPRLRWHVASRAPGATAFGAQQSAPDDLFDVVAYGSSRTLAGFQRQIGPPEVPRTKLQVRFGRTSGSFGHATTVVDDDQRLVSPAIAANADRDAALAWFADRATADDRLHARPPGGGTAAGRVYVSLRRAGGSFGAPIQLAEGRIRSVDVAVGPEGQVLVAWDMRGPLRAPFRPSMKRPFGGTETIRSDEAFFAQLHAAVGNSGRAYLA